MPVCLLICKLLTGMLSPPSTGELYEEISVTELICLYDTCHAKVINWREEGERLNSGCCRCVHKEMQLFSVWAKGTRTELNILGGGEGHYIIILQTILMCKVRHKQFAEMGWQWYQEVLAVIFGDWSLLLQGKASWARAKVAYHLLFEGRVFKVSKIGMLTWVAWKFAVFWPCSRIGYPNMGSLEEVIPLLKRTPWKGNFTNLPVCYIIFAYPRAQTQALLDLQWLHVNLLLW